MNKLENKNIELFLQNNYNCPYRTTIIVSAAVKKLAQNIGRSYSGSGNTAKCKTCIEYLQKNKMRQLNIIAK